MLCAQEKYRMRQSNCLFCLNAMWILSAEWLLKLVKSKRSEMLSKN